MKKRMLTMLLSILLVACLLPVVALADEVTVTEAVDSDGDGYVEIDTAEKLWWFTQQVNGGNKSLNAELTANIDLTGTCGENIGNWLPIGNQYSGHFNGQGYTVSNLYMTGNDQYVGLFGYVKGATIENVTVTGSISSTLSYVVEGYRYYYAAAGGIVAYLNGGTIRNCHVDMTVKGEMYIGGICGDIDSYYGGLIENCTSRGTVECPGASTTAGQCIGGIVGQNFGTVRGCTNEAKVTNQQQNDYYNAYMGGIAGANDKTIESCINYGSIVGNSNALAGGIVGNQIGDAVIRNCGNHGAVSGAYAGGVIGDNLGCVANCYNAGSISATNDSTEYVAPVANSRGDDASVTNCYYLNGTATDDGGRTAAQFASGQVAYELNGSTTTDESVWKQTLGTDSYPALTGALVYCNEVSECTDTSTSYTEYSNIQRTIVHTGNEYKLDGTCNLLWSCCEAAVTGDTLESIAITTTPTKTEYTYGDSFDKTGMVVTATYASGNTADVTEAVTIGSEMLTVETTSVSISYEGFTATQAITVNPMVIGKTNMALTTLYWEYTGEPVTVYFTVWGYQYKEIPASEYTVSYSNNTEIGQATVTFSDNPGGNYEVNASLTFNIVEAELKDVSVSQNGTLTYTGEAQTPAVDTSATTVDGAEVTFTYCDTEDGTYTAELPTFTNAGTYTVYFKANAERHEEYSGSFEVVIGKATNEWTTCPSIQGWTYGEYPNDPTAVPKFGKVEYDDFSYRAKGTDAWSSNPPTDAGTYELKTRVPAADNWELLQTTIEFTIAKATPAAPTEGEGYTIDYAAETITVAEGYEVSTATDGTGTKITTGGSITDYLGQTLYVRKLESDNYTASGWTAFTLAGRPKIPSSLSCTHETLKGKQDGTVNGLDNTMEVSVNGRDWTTASGDLTGLASGTTVTLRVKATDTAPHGTEATCTILEGAAITVAYDSNNKQASNMPAQLTGLTYGGTLTKPADPTAVNTDFVFDGWYKESGCTTPWNFDEDTLTEANVTLYAKWKQIRFLVQVEVKDDSGVEYNDATVKLMRGADTIDTITGGTSGYYTFNTHVEAGMYNVVVTYADDEGTHTKTELVTVSENATVPVTLPAPGVNSHLTVSNDADTPAVMVGGLDAEAEALKTDGVTNVTVTMAVEGQQEAEVGAAVVKAIADVIPEDSFGEKNVPVVEYLDISMTKQINQGDKTAITETSKVMELVIPFVFDGKSTDSIVVVRYHGTTAQKLTLDNSKNDGTYQLNTDTGFIHIYTQKFSTYAIAYTLNEGYTITFDANDGTSVPTATTGTDGKLTSLPTPTREGYAFDGWFMSDGTKVTEDTVFKADTTLTAKWTKNSSGGGIFIPGSCTLTFQVDGGSAMDSITKTSGSTIDLAGFVPTREGYNFTGWYSDEDCTVPVSSVKLTENMTVYAGWKKNAESVVFTDVYETDYYYDAVYWAVENGITGGTGATTFSPLMDCTRAQAVMFLWRGAGSPEPATSVNPFTDISPEQYYYKAVLWAVEQGITSGTSLTTFGPDTTVTRAQVMTFLYRLAGSPAVTGSNGFSDVADDDYYADAVLWAVEYGITSGTGPATFSPQQNCNRSQIVTFLWQYFAT